MRHRVVRLPHFALLAPAVIAVMTSVSSVSAHAQSAPPGVRATPYVVCIDPGHGGSPNNGDPTQPYDSGALGIGLVEKDLTLDVSERLKRQLEAHGVSVTMTRTDDSYVSIGDRETTCEQANADLFVSIHFNYFTDPSVEGSLVLYPTPASQAFATTMTTALGTTLATDRIAGAPPQLRDNWWTHATMPTITVEGAYITSPHDAALLHTGAFRDRLATAIRGGIETYEPGIQQRAAALRAWYAAHPVATPAPAVHSAAPAAPAGRDSGGAALIVFLVVGAAGIGAWRHPRTALTLTRRLAQVAFVVGSALATLLLVLAMHAPVIGEGVTRARQTRRRRHAVRRRAHAYRRSRSARPHARYDSLWG